MFAAVLSEDAQAALAVLGKSGIVKDAYLAGGSALALHFGHRRSEDFDFFSQHPVDPRKISAALKKIGTFQESVAKGISLIGEFEGIKLSYFQYDYPLLAQAHAFLGVVVSDPQDIAAMKIAAVMDRGTKRDFVDLYVLNQKGTGFEDMFELYNKKYGVFEGNTYSIIRSLQYFDDAETTDMPEMLISLSWDEVKAFFITESVRLAKRHLE